MSRLKWSALNLILPGFAALLAIVLLTEGAYIATASLGGKVPEDFYRWTAESPAARFDDLTDDQVLANIVFRIRDPRLSYWTYFFPRGLPPHDVWSWLKSALQGNELYKARRQGSEDGTSYLHHYWTGHMVLTVWVVFLVQSLATASRLIQSWVLVGLFVYLLVWYRHFGGPGAVVVAVVMVCSGVLRVESFHNNNWGMIVAFGGAVSCGVSLSRGNSVYPSAVVSAILAGWVGYDHVWDTLALSLPFFLTRTQRGLELEHLPGPATFGLVFMVTSALMMAMRVPVTYLDGQSVSAFLSQLETQFLHHVWTGRPPASALLNTGEVGNIARADEVSRQSAILGALPVYNQYLFSFLGRLAPQFDSVRGYAMFQMLPVAALPVAALARRSLGSTGWKGTLLVLTVGLLFHAMFLVFVNHAYIHPWMDVRHAVFWAALGWGLVASAIRPAP